MRRRALDEVARTTAMSSYVALSLGCLLGALGQVMFKLGANGVETLAGFANLRILVGLTSYAVSTALWIFALSRVPLNVAYAFTALTFCLVYLFSNLWLGEEIRLRGWVALAFIVCGFLIVATDPGRSP